MTVIFSCSRRVSHRGPIHIGPCSDGRSRRVRYTEDPKRNMRRLYDTGCNEQSPPSDGAPEQLRSNGAADPGPRTRQHMVING